MSLRFSDLTRHRPDRALRLVLVLIDVHIVRASLTSECTTRIQKTHRCTIRRRPAAHCVLDEVEELPGAFGHFIVVDRANEPSQSKTMDVPELSSERKENQTAWKGATTAGFLKS